MLSQSFCELRGSHGPLGLAGAASARWVGNLDGSVQPCAAAGLPGNPRALGQLGLGPARATRVHAGTAPVPLHSTYSLVREDDVIMTRLN